MINRCNHRALSLCIVHYALCIGLSFALSATAADFYVAMPADGGDDGNPGTQASPFTTIGAAITAADTAISGGDTSATIHVADGTYTEYGLTLANPITIVGESGNRDAVIVDANRAGRAFMLNHADATLSSITVRNGFASGNGNAAGGNVRIGANGGTVRNCVISGGHATAHDTFGINIYMAAGLVVDSTITGVSVNLRHTAGMDIYMTGGRVSRCVISNAIGGSYNDWELSAVTMTAGLLDNCLVTGNKATWGAVYVNGASARMVNCTVAGNTGGTRTGVYVGNASARVVNCALYDNGGTATKEWGNNNAACFYNCAFSSAAAFTGANSTVKNINPSTFATDASGNYMPAVGGGLIDVGTDPSSYTTLDCSLALNGVSHPSGAGWDIGSYELDQGVLACGFAPSSIVARNGDAITFTPTVYGAGGASLTYKWDFDDGGAAVTTAEAPYAYAFGNTKLHMVTLSVSTDGGSTWAASFTHAVPILSAPADLYVDAGNDSGAAYPYATAATAATTLADALNVLTNSLSAGATALGGVTIHVADGTYPENALPKIASAVVVEGNASDRTAVKIGKTGARVFHVADAGAMLRNLTVQNGQSLGKNTSTAAAGGNVRLEAGVVTNCVIKGASSGQDIVGANFFISGGTVVDCLIDGSSGGINSMGQGAYMTGGSVVRCRIVNQKSGSNGSFPSLGVGAYVAGGVIENCLIAGNTSGIGALYLNGGTAVNCTVAGNTPQFSNKCVGIYVNNNSSSAINCVVFGNGGTAVAEWGDNGKGARFFNCASSVAISGGTSCVTLPASYLESFGDNVDWVPVTGSDIIDTGDDARYLAAYSRTDLLGNPRVSPANGSIDIGCYEFDQDSFSFTPSVTSHPSILTGGTVDFALSTMGATDTITFEIDFGDGSANLVTTASSVTRQFDSAGFFHARARAKVGNGAYGEWADIAQPVRVSMADIYVSGDDGDDSNPGTAAAPFKTVAYALGTLTNVLSACATDVDGVTVHVAGGSYPENALPKIATAVVVEGDASDRTAVKIGKTGGRVFLISNAGAALRNLTVQNGKSAGGKNSMAAAGGNVHLAAGTVTNCVITAGSAGQDIIGANFFISGGMVVDCLIDGSSGGINSMGQGAYMTGGSVVRCRIVNQKSGSNGNWPSLGVGAYVAGGVIENCLVSGNTSGIGALYLDGGNAVNCTVVANTPQFSNKCLGIYMKAAASRAANCAIYGNGGTAVTEFGVANAGYAINLTNCAFSAEAAYAGTASTVTNLSDVAFKDYANGDYRPKGSLSPLVNGGTRWGDYLGYGALSATDLAGAARLNGRHLDIGCYENQASAATTITLR